MVQGTQRLKEKEEVELLLQALEQRFHCSPWRRPQWNRYRSRYLPDSVCHTRAPWCFLKELQPTVEPVGTAREKDQCWSRGKV